MKRTFSCLALVMLLSLIALAQEKQTPAVPNGNGTTSGPAPLLVIESTTHDFGEVKAGTPLRYTFKIKNEGKADLLINNVAPS
jgi:Protein of unknown function (DUF1573)